MDSKTLRKAVELADGWSIRKTQNIPPRYDITCGALGATYSYGEWVNLPQPVKDALAAQLKRQTIAAGYPVWVTDQGVTVWSKPMDTPYGEARQFKAQIEGDGDSDNTINAIVESKVLE